MAVLLSGANGSLYFACGVYGTSGKIQGFFPFGFAQGQNDEPEGSLWRENRYLIRFFPGGSILDTARSAIYFVRSTIPPASATNASVAIPRNSPCSTTPTIASSFAAIAWGSSIRTPEQSRIRLPSSVM